MTVLITPLNHHRHLRTATVSVKTKAKKFSVLVLGRILTSLQVLKSGVKNLRQINQVNSPTSE